MARWRRQNKTSNEFCSRHSSPSKSPQNTTACDANFAARQLLAVKWAAPIVFTRKSGCCVCSRSWTCAARALYWLLARSTPNEMYSMKPTTSSPGHKVSEWGRVERWAHSVAFCRLLHPEFGKTAESAEMKWLGAENGWSSCSLEYSSSFLGNASVTEGLC